MKRLAVTANCSKPQAESVLRRLVDRATRQGLHVSMLGDTARLLPGCPSLDSVQLADEVDLLIALGGDGTMISAVHLLDGTDIPVLGVNLGSLGFMTAVAEEDLEDAVDAVAAGQFSLSTRTMACCEVNRKKQNPVQYTALNDMVLGWGSSSRLVSLALHINGEHVTSYDCDGLIVSTPTGSTGHSLSAGGPVLHPETEALLVHVICPHALSARPLVVPDTCRLDVSLEKAPAGKELLLSVDGQQQASLSNGDIITVRKHPTGVHFLHPPGYSYFEVLRRKLHWRGSTI